ncbi:MAG: phenylalanine--tRNA ligase subunit beta [Candidatus Babeliales bacterium]|jgi:phenylalanyl-tRNA synthetase beta chain
MKLSLAWIFDHIDADWKQQDIDKLVALFNKRTAEVEDFYRIAFDLQRFFIGRCTNTSAQSVILEIPELGKDIELPLRTKTIDMIPTSVKQPCFMVVKEAEHSYRWATLTDFGVEKDGLVPALDVTMSDINGAWREKFEDTDVILEIDNKSITNRPDMWGHRGFAREIAAFLNLSLKPEAQFLHQLPIQAFAHTSQATATTPFTLTNHAPHACTRFEGLYFPTVENHSSNLLLASRLMKVGSRPINALVDAVNYCMLDWSLPMHAYDATSIVQKSILIRMAQDQEQLPLLDGETLSLSTQDLVIADPQKPLCLAGIMGGIQSGLTAATTAAFIEAAAFDAGTIRRTAQRSKKRTEASARFEKTMDPHQCSKALQRLLKICASINLKLQHADEIVAAGTLPPPSIIEVTHEFLEERSGIKLSEEQVTRPLRNFEFNVIKSHNAEHKTVYLITIPSFRATKDIKIKEDILEEIVRSYGFENITPQLPRLLRTAFDLTPTTRLNAIKHFLASSAHMTEQQNYAMYDEQFLAQLHLKLDAAVTLVNPVSENFSRMAGSLIPALFKNVIENHQQRDALAFFECGRIWRKASSPEEVERLSIAGIFFAKRATIDFYACKQHLCMLFKELGCAHSSLVWEKPHATSAPWYSQHQTAIISANKLHVGIAGKVDTQFLAKLDIGAPCDAFVFELEGDILSKQAQPIPHYQSLNKYPATYFDLSLLVPLAGTVAIIEHTLKQTSDLIMQVELIDKFEKGGSSETRALTFRIWLAHPERTLEKNDIETTWKAAVAALAHHNIQVRS